MNPNQPPQPIPFMQPVTDIATAGAGDLRDYEFFTVNEAMPIENRTIMLEGAKWAIVEVWFVLLRPQEDKRAFERAGAQSANPMILGQCQALEAMRFVKVAPINSKIDPSGQPVETIDMGGLCERSCSMHNGTTEGLWRLMHPAMRGDCVLAYTVMSNSPEAATAGFVKSRRRATR